MVVIVFDFNVAVIIRVGCDKIWQQFMICWACCFVIVVTDGGVDITLGDGLNAVGFRPSWILGTVVAVMVGHVGIKDNSTAGALTKLCLFSVVVPTVLKVAILIRFLVSFFFVDAVVVAFAVVAIVVVLLLPLIFGFLLLRLFFLILVSVILLTGLESSLSFSLIAASMAAASDSVVLSLPSDLISFFSLAAAAAPAAAATFLSHL